MRALGAVRGQFKQTDWDGLVRDGRFALQRPGKLRFDYTDETLLVVSDGFTLSIQDRELETTDAVPLAATPLGSILSGDSQFRDTSVIVETLAEGNAFYVTLKDKRDDWSGQLTLKFGQADNKLIGWVTLDETGAGTHVDLYNIDYSPKLNPRLFIVQE